MPTNDIKERHHVSIKGIFNKHTVRTVFISYAMFFSLVITGIIAPLLFFGKNHNSFEALKIICDLVIVLLPNLLGFCIGGYALIIGAGNLDILKLMSMPIENKGRLSYYQILSSVFAMSLVIQCFTLFVAFIVNILLSIEFTPISYLLGVIVNFTIMSIMLLLVVFSMMLLYCTIINIFNFGQSTHFVIRLSEENKDITNENTDKI